MGGVGLPGPYPLPPGGTRLPDWVGAAGGFLPTADLASMRVFRSSGLAGDPDPEMDRLPELSRKEMTAAEYEGLLARLTARRGGFRGHLNPPKHQAPLHFPLRSGGGLRGNPVGAAGPGE